MRFLPLLLLPGLAWSAPCDELADGVERARLEESLHRLTGLLPADGTSLDSRHVLHPHHDLAQAWLAGALAAAGVPAQEEPFTAPGLPPLANLIADLPGVGDRVVLSAHLDSTGKAADGWNGAEDPAPGADDDASGLAAVLEAARLLASHDPGFERPLRFALFDAEEEGLLGSHHRADAADAAGEGIALVLNFDPIGFNAGSADRLWVTWNPDSEAEAAAIEAWSGRWSPLDITAVNADLIGGDARSDHYPYWLAGYPALHISSFPQPPEYHTPDDLPDGVDLDFLSEVTRIAVRRACELARPLAPEAEAPAEEGAGCAASLPGRAAPSLLLALALRLPRRRQSRR